MKNKQIVAFLIAAAVFIVTGASSVAVNHWAEQTERKESQKLYSTLFGGQEDSEVATPQEDYVAVIEVEGTITSEVQTSTFGEEQGYNHQKTLRYIDQLMEDKNNKAILLEMNTPGGAVTAADEMYLKLQEYKEKTGRKVYCYYGEQSCSGGVYISMAADEIYSNRNAMTGSIGVIVSLTNMKGLYDKLGIKEIDITSGENKAMGSAGQNLTKKQREILQSYVDEAYEQFVGIVAEGRNMDVAKVKKLADGRIYTAKQSEKLGLIDGIVKTKDEYLDKIKEELGKDINIFTRPSDSFGLANLFASIEQLKPQSDAEVIREALEQGGMGGVMYYAEGLQ